MRSLVTKVYLYAIVSVLIAAAAALGLARTLIEAGELDGVRRFGIQHARFIATELERTATTAGPSAARMRELGPPLHATLMWVPWSQPARYPAGLRHIKAYFAPAPWPGPSWRVYWIRLDHGTRPLGALRVTFVPPVAARPSMPFLALGLWIGGLALLIVPPLLFWVVRPLRRMVRLADRLGRGDLTTPIRVTRGDEIGQLEAAFESLRVRLARMIAQREALLRDVSHELRGPLSRMSIALPLARLKPEGTYLDKLEAEVTTMDALIGEILELSRAHGEGGWSPGPLDLAELASALIAPRELQAAAQGLTLTQALTPAPGSGDARLLARAMGNLLDNALKYTPPGGHVHVETAPGLFRVTDDGPGIPEAARPHVFEPFWRPDDSRSRETGGTGIGLAIVRAVAERHQGQATLTAPATGSGTVATLTIG